MGTVEPIRSIEDLRNVEKILAQNPKDLLLFTLGTNCGLRVSDIVALNVGDVQGKTHVRIVEQKTGKPKTFPINEKLKPMLDKFVKNKSPEEPLFKTLFDNRLDRYGAYYIIKNACKKAGIQAKIGTHTMRKTFGYHHYKKFKDIAMLQKLLNHASPQITLRYIGIDQEEIDESYTNFVL